MVMKTFIAATCAAAFAGGMVYFTTSPADIGGSATIENDASINKTRSSKDIISRYIGEENEADIVAEVSVDEADNPYVVETEEETHPHPIETVKKDTEDFAEPEPEPEPENRYEASEKNEEAELKVFELEVTESGIEFEDPMEQLRLIEREMERDVSEEEIAAVESNQEEQDGNIQANEETKISEPARSDRVIEADRHDLDPAERRIQVVFEQAEKIDVPDLRDRAYLDLVDYATSKGLFGEAQKATKKIRQVELRDTARERIAMGMARYGLSDEAFEIVETIELDELRDVMRLRVIEALLGTDRRR